MDITLVKTFLAVATSRSFVSAANILHVTQSAVSMRVQKLEEILGQRLFERSKAGVTLTHAGHQFEPMARNFLHLWDETRFSVSLPDRYKDTLALACEESLWPELSASWLSNLRANLPSTAFSFQVSTPDAITTLLRRGLVQMAVLYNPQVRAGFHVEEIMEDRLILVTGNRDRGANFEDDYVYTDWGPEFALNHARWFPTMVKPQITLHMGTGVVKYLIRNRNCTYLPYRIADDYIAAGELFWLREAPTMEYPAYAVRSMGLKGATGDKALDLLREAGKHAPWIDISPNM